jgi:hypothetical protein
MPRVQIRPDPNMGANPPRLAFGDSTPVPVGVWTDVTTQTKFYVDENGYALKAGAWRDNVAYDWLVADGKLLFNGRIRFGTTTVVYDIA